MNKILAISLVALGACASTSGALGRRAAADSVVGPWHGVLVKGENPSIADFRFSSRDGALSGFYWGPARTAVALSNVQLGNSIHFEIPPAAVFEGTVSGDTIQGTFRDGDAGGSFKLEKQIDWD